ncbi:MAG: O-antigen ligase family protein [bacterium]|nr:O-antigen ligase family protein [bacterium]
MPKNKKATWLERVLLLAPVVVWFSYLPNFHFGQAEGANLEFSLPMIYIVVLALVGLPHIWQNREKLFASRAVWLTEIFILWNIFSIIGSENPLRTVLTGGVWFVLWLDFLAILSFKNLSKIMPKLAKIFFISSLAMAILVILQVAYGAWFDWGLCRGCVASGFGFVRPSVFAIEPQFFGSLLLAPILILLHKQFSKTASKFESWILWLDLLALYLTLSRGAIFALGVAILVLIFANQKFSKIKIWRNLVVSVALVASAFLSGMIWHAIFTELNPRVTDGFYDSIAKSVNQMSLGKIELPKSVEKPVENSESEVTETEKKAENSENENQPKEAAFDGYVEKSTDERTKLSNLAIRTWLRNPFTTVFGAGAGGAGMAIYKTTGETSSSAEIVQNEYLSILLELGAIGLAVFAAIICGFIYSTKDKKWKWAILAAFLVQWIFFGGLPNALHIYLILAIIFADKN